MRSQVQQMMTQIRKTVQLLSELNVCYQPTKQAAARHMIQASAMFRDLGQVESDQDPRLQEHLFDFIDFFQDFRQHIALESILVDKITECQSVISTTIQQMQQFAQELSGSYCRLEACDRDQHPFRSQPNVDSRGYRDPLLNEFHGHPKQEVQRCLADVSRKLKKLTAARDELVGYQNAHQEHHNAIDALRTLFEKLNIPTHEMSVHSAENKENEAEMLQRVLVECQGLETYRQALPCVQTIMSQPAKCGDDNGENRSAASYPRAVA